LGSGTAADIVNSNMVGKLFSTMKCALQRQAPTSRSGASLAARRRSRSDSIGAL
jgi:hypothetical protein